jgi:hypothetical protein
VSCVVAPYPFRIEPLEDFDPIRDLDVTGGGDVWYARPLLLWRDMFEVALNTVQYLWGDNGAPFAVLIQARFSHPTRGGKRQSARAARALNAERRVRAGAATRGGWTCCGSK